MLCVHYNIDLSLKWTLCKVFLQCSVRARVVIVFDVRWICAVTRQHNVSLCVVCCNYHVRRFEHVLLYVRRWRRRLHRFCKTFFLCVCVCVLHKSAILCIIEHNCIQTNPRTVSSTGTHNVQTAQTKPGKSSDKCGTYAYVYTVRNNNNNSKGKGTQHNIHTASSHAWPFGSRHPASSDPSFPQRIAPRTRTSFTRAHWRMRVVYSTRVVYIAEPRQGHAATTHDSRLWEFKLVFRNNKSLHVRHAWWLCHECVGGLKVVRNS